jgi:Ca2+-binding RTX toxin-like protein
VIDENGTQGGSADTLILTGVTSSQVEFHPLGQWRDPDHRALRSGAHDGGSVELLNIVSSGQRGIERIRLDDVTWTADQLRAKVIAASATAGNDRITGFEGADTISGAAGRDTLLGLGGNDSLSGGAGDDSLIGGDGNDTYVWARGDGNDVIDENGTLGGSADTLILTGVTSSQVSFTRSGNGAILTIAPSARGRTMAAASNCSISSPAGSAAVERIRLDDATWTADQLRAKVIAASATAGNDRITGFDGADTISGAAGADTLEGGAGNDWLDGGVGNDLLTGGAGLDNFVIKQGFGRDTITDFGATPANQDLLQVSNKVFANMQAFMAGARQSGTDVIITATPTDVLTLKNVTLASLDAADLRFTA